MKPKLTGLVFTLILIAAALSALDQSLARLESAEVESTAQGYYRQGSLLLAAGKAREAVDPLREAHAEQRQNPAYELALITALGETGTTADAKPLMDDMLQREPNDGEVNLIAAPLASREGDTADAEAYYHRAIYGEWPSDAAKHRVAVRMELIDYLKKRGENQELLAELISLGAESGLSLDDRRRLAQLFMEADSPARAADLYEAMADKNPADIVALEGLGDAELEQGRYNAARVAYQQAFFHDPTDPSIQLHLRTLNTVVALDPTLRQLTSGEKYQRSIRILDMARMELDQCMAKTPEGATGDAAKALAAADAAIAAKPPAHVTNEAAEGVLAVAESVWHSRNGVCSSGAGGADALNLLMKKLST